MADEPINIGTIRDGPNEGERVSLPIVDVLTGRGFVTGKSGAGKSNSVSVIAERLLDRGYALLIVDIDGEYFGLKEQYEVLHVGDDEECDVRVGPEHAEKLATLALEENVPIILDSSSYLDESDARSLLTALTRQLFAKERTIKRPFLLLVEEIHEYIPQSGGLDDCGRMLIKIGKRGRKRGLGMIGISQRPADVKKDFITQCDWRCWHRLTWKNDTQVVRRVLDGTYAQAVETLEDGEAFLRTDWSSDIQRIQFDRKETFDAGATPGLESVERPSLKSVEETVVDELESIANQDKDRNARIEALEAELAAKNDRIEQLERELQQARDLRELAEQFTSAFVTHADEHESREVEDAVAKSTAENGVNGASSPKVDDFDTQRAATTDENGITGDGDESRPETESAQATESSSAVEQFAQRLESLDEETRAMLANYYTDGPLTPLEAYRNATGTADRTAAYQRNNLLRNESLITHVGRGTYTYSAPAAIADDTRGSDDGSRSLATIEWELLVKDTQTF
ncbi:helicase HerA domain-containing protein [Halocatena halophila]|uniref:helicase HerA domain-containing protein n=1 Tax=Halocatena halophila TaxID=2814576 RepID=UPI002ED4624B